MKKQMMNLTLNQMIEAFTLTEEMEMTEELPTVRGWLMDGIEKLATAESFEKWIETDDINEIKAK